MEKLGFQARAPRGVKLSKPPPRKLSTGEICKDERENSEIQELSKLVQNSSTELNNNCLAEDYRLTTGSDPDGLNLCSVCDHSEGDTYISLLHIFIFVSLSFIVVISFVCSSGLSNFIQLIFWGFILK